MKRNVCEEVDEQHKNLADKTYTCTDDHCEERNEKYPFLVFCNLP
jgi:hypothetical protein